jgi:hypothetical protein
MQPAELISGLLALLPAWPSSDRNRGQDRAASLIDALRLLRVYRILALVSWVFRVRHPLAVQIPNQRLIANRTCPGGSGGCSAIVNESSLP